MSTLKVEVVKIDAIEEHPNADRLEIAIIRGWACVVPKGRYKPGSLVVYIPIDSVLPQNIEEILFSGSKIKLHDSRVRTVKIRGAISQGLAADPELLGLDYACEGDDVTERLGIKKYEPPFDLSPSGWCNPRSKRESNPEFKEYTDIQHFKNFNRVFKEGEPVVVTEKIHGTNFRCGIVKKKPNNIWERFLQFVGILPKREFIYGSRRVQLKPNDLRSDVYISTAQWYRIEKKLKTFNSDADIVFYGEIYGPKIQKGYGYGLNPGMNSLVVFDVMVDGKYVDYMYAKIICDRFGLPYVPVLAVMPFDIKEIKKLSTGPSVLCPDQKVREGCVIRPLGEEKSPIIGRKVLKLINDDYLLDHKNTDFH